MQAYLYIFYFTYFSCRHLQDFETTACSTHAMMMWQFFAVLYLSVCALSTTADTTSDERLAALEAKFEDMTRKRWFEICLFV